MTIPTPNGARIAPNGVGTAPSGVRATPNGVIGALTVLARHGNSPNALPFQTNSHPRRRRLEAAK